MCFAQAPSRDRQRCPKSNFLRKLCDQFASTVAMIFLPELFQEKGARGWGMLKTKNKHWKAICKLLRLGDRLRVSSTIEGAPLQSEWLMESPAPKGQLSHSHPCSVHGSGEGCWCVHPQRNIPITDCQKTQKARDGETHFNISLWLSHSPTPK